MTDRTYNSKTRHSTFITCLKLSVLMILIMHTLPSKAVTEDQFSVQGLSVFKDEQATMLTSWLSQGVNATRATLGIYPTPLAIHVYPKKSNQPVPWAFTRRDAKGSVHFYVDTRFGLTKFVDDWTIYHEFAHLALPYLGQKYRWLSEGFASYMQYQIMQEMGVYTKDEVDVLEGLNQLTTGLGVRVLPQTV